MRNHSGSEPASTPQSLQRELHQFIKIAIDAVDPVKLVSNCEQLRAWIQARQTTGFFLLAAGKAAAGMAAGVSAMLAIPARAVLVVPEGQASLARQAMPGADVFEGDHPLPTERSVAAGQAGYRLAEDAGKVGMPLLVLLSGGASAMLCLPAEEVELDDLRSVTLGLQRAGADIDELNCVRKHCERLKGGRLAQLASPASVATFLLSDVVGNRLETIASGPTVADPTTYGEALDVLRTRGVLEAAPTVRHHLERGVRSEIGETPKPGELDASRVQNQIIGENATALAAIEHAARIAGFEVIPRRDVQGEARDQAAEFVVQLRRERARCRSHVCLLWGGETTVALPAAGEVVGGRNHEAALVAAIMIEGDPTMAAAMIATDGLDGSTGATGAIVTGSTAMMARRAGLDPEEYLARHDSGTFFQKAVPAAEQVKLGATGTNVNDLWIGLA